MQKAKAFFLVCAGFFLLALSYHLGARSADAQSAFGIAGGVWEGSATMATGGTLYSVRLNDHTGIDSEPTSIPLDRSGDVVDAVAHTSSETPAVIGDAWVIYSDGEVRHYRSGEGWSVATNLFSGAPTPITTESWGAVKDRYRR